MKGSASCCLAIIFQNLSSPLLAGYESSFLGMACKAFSNTTHLYPNLIRSPVTTPHQPILTSTSWFLLRPCSLLLCILAYALPLARKAFTLSSVLSAGDPCLTLQIQLLSEASPDHTSRARSSMPQEGMVPLCRHFSTNGHVLMS